MPQGDKSSYTDKQKRQAEHIEAGYEEKGVSTKESEARAWATVNKLSGGGKLSGSGRKKPGRIPNSDEAKTLFWHRGWDVGGSRNRCLLL